MGRKKLAKWYNKGIEAKGLLFQLHQDARITSGSFIAIVIELQPALNRAEDILIGHYDTTGKEIKALTAKLKYVVQRANEFIYKQRNIKFEHSQLQEIITHSLKDRTTQIVEVTKPTEKKDPNVKVYKAGSNVPFEIRHAKNGMFIFNQDVTVVKGLNRILVFAKSVKPRIHASLMDFHPYYGDRPIVHKRKTLVFIDPYQTYKMYKLGLSPLMNSFQGVAERMAQAINLPKSLVNSIKTPETLPHIGFHDYDVVANFVGTNDSLLGRSILKE